jgi:hypothetical protein
MVIARKHPGVETPGYCHSSLRDRKNTSRACYQLSTFDHQLISLPFVFALAEFFIDLEAGFLGVREGDRLELVRRTEIGNDFAHRLPARGAVRERLGRKRTVQGELPAANLAVAFAQFVFVKRHQNLGVCRT